MLTRSELARKEELELLDIAWQAVSGGPEGDDAQELTNEPGFVDAGDNLGDNGTTSDDSEEGRK